MATEVSPYRMIKMCGESLVRPLSIIFQNSLNSCICPSTWKKANVIPVHKKYDKQCVNNCQSVLLVPGKMFEKLISNEIHLFFDRKKLLNTNQFLTIRFICKPAAQLLIITKKYFLHLTVILQ